MKGWWVRRPENSKEYRMTDNKGQSLPLRPQGKDRTKVPISLNRAQHCSLHSREVTVMLHQWNLLEPPIQSLPEIHLLECWRKHFTKRYLLEARTMKLPKRGVGEAAGCWVLLGAAVCVVGAWYYRSCLCCRNLAVETPLRELNGRKILLLQCLSIILGNAYQRGLISICQLAKENI